MTCLKLSIIMLVKHKKIETKKAKYRKTKVTLRSEEAVSC